MGHTLNDVIQCLLLQLPECIAYYLSSSFSTKIFLTHHLLEYFEIRPEATKVKGWLPMDHALNDDILTDSMQYILVIVVTGVEWRH